MKADELLAWFTEEILPLLLETGAFSQRKGKQTIDKFELEHSIERCIGLDEHFHGFAPVPCFARLILKTYYSTDVYEVLIKFQSQNPVYRDKMRLITQYLNEIALYNEVYPSVVEFLKYKGQTSDYVNQIFPQCYFASTGDGDQEKAILILEDLRKQGFRLSENPIELDLKHCCAAVEKLAEFHALSFAMKFANWSPFERLKRVFSSVWMEDTPECRERCDDFHSYIYHRGIDYLLAQENCEVPKEYLQRLREVLKPTFQLLQSLEMPQEPLAVLSHGSFNRNGVLFRYVNGEELEARLTDFQKVFYGSPNIDLGYMIYLNMTQEDRTKHFDEIFQHYHSTLMNRISTLLKEPVENIADRLPIQSFKKDFERVALYHYVNVAFFLPLMLCPPEEFEDSVTDMSFRAMAVRNYKRGGPVASKRVSDVLVDFYRRKFYMNI